MAARLDYEEDSGMTAKVLLLWLKRWQPISRLSTNVAREVCSYLHSRVFILGLWNQVIAVFDIRVHSFRSASLSKSIPNTCAFSSLTNKSILILGFGDKSVYSLSFPDLNFALLPEMRVGRERPGVIRCGAFIYVFGGHNAVAFNLVSSERYSVYEGVWQALPDMHQAMPEVCPALHKRCIYLPIFAGVNVVECFDTESLAFTIYCKLPNSSFVSVAAVVDDELVILTWEKSYKVSLRKTTEVKEEHRLLRFSGVMSTKSTPLVIGRKVWFTLKETPTAVEYCIDEQLIRTFSEEDRT